MAEWKYKSSFRDSFSLFEKQNGKSSTLVKIEIVVKLANSDIAAQAIAILDNKVGRL